MKKALILLLIIILLVGGFFGGRILLKQMKINKIKSGWYVEILYEKGINVREDHSTEGEPMGSALPGEVYSVEDVYLDSKIYFWYKIDFDGKTGWVANKRGEEWLKDVNNPNDIMAPIIKFKDNIYKTVSINDIDYKHLVIVDDKDDYKITHKVYYEYNYIEARDQYWIAYTATDASGKSTTKMQKIEFAEVPDKSLILPLSEYNKQ